MEAVILINLIGINNLGLHLGALKAGSSLQLCSTKPNQTKPNLPQVPTSEECASCILVSLCRQIERKDESREKFFCFLLNFFKKRLKLIFMLPLR